MWYGRADRNTACMVILLNLSSRAFPLDQLLYLLVPPFLHHSMNIILDCAF